MSSKVIASLVVFGLITSAQAAAENVTMIITYPSTVSVDGDGPLDLQAELNYDDARMNAPINQPTGFFTMPKVVDTTKADGRFVVTFEDGQTVTVEAASEPHARTKARSATSRGT